MNKKFRKIYIEITNVCNLNCRFCPDSVRKPTFMAPENFEKVINEVKEYTDLISLHVKGEPLIHPNFKEILEICDKNNIKVNLTTNGVLLSSVLKVLLESKSIRQINVSIHSVTQNDNIDVKKYLNDVFNSCDKLKDKIIISYRLWNINEIKSNDKNKYILDCLGKKYNIQGLYDFAKSHNFVKLNDNVFLNQDIQFRWPDINDKNISESGTCLGLKNHIAILSNGDVVPCCLDQNADILLGNIFDVPLSEILTYKKSMDILKGFNNNKLTEKLCKTCGFRKRFDKGKIE